jgi:hypothetical protein
MVERFKDIEIEGTKYRVEKFSAKIAMWIAAQIFTKIAPMGMDGQLNMGNLPEGRQLMTEKEFSDLIDYCMCGTKRYEAVGNAEVPMPIMMEKGKWLLPDLEYDLMTVVALCVHVLTFNIASFFNDGSLKKLMASVKDIPLFNTQQ